MPTFSKLSVDKASNLYWIGHSRTNFNDEELRFGVVPGHFGQHAHPGWFLMEQKLWVEKRNAGSGGFPGCTRIHFEAILLKRTSRDSKLMIGLLKVRYITDWHPSWTIDLPNDFLDMGHFVLCRLVEFRGYRTHFWILLPSETLRDHKWTTACHSPAGRTPIKRLGCVAHVQQNGTSSTNIFPTREDIVPLRCFTGRKREDTLGDGCQSGPPHSKHEHEINMFLRLPNIIGYGMVETRSAGGENQKAAGNFVCSFNLIPYNSLINPWFKKGSIGIDPSSRPWLRTWNSFQLWLWRSSWPEGGVAIGIHTMVTIPFYFRITWITPENTNALWNTAIRIPKFVKSHAEDMGQWAALITWSPSHWEANHLPLTTFFCHLQGARQSRSRFWISPVAIITESDHLGFSSHAKSSILSWVYKNQWPKS